MHELGLEALGMLAHALHERRARQAMRIAGPVVDVGRRHELATLLEPGDQQRLAIGARGVDRRRVAGGPGAEDDQARVAGTAHVYFLPRLIRASTPTIRRGIAKYAACSRQSKGGMVSNSACWLGKAPPGMQL